VHWSIPSRQGRIAGAGALFAFALLITAAFGTFRAQADDPQILNVTVTDSSMASADDAVDLTSLTYAQAVDAFAALDPSLDPPGPGTATLPIAPTGFSISATGAELHRDDAKTSLVVLGTNVELLGLDASMLVTAVWDDSSDTSADTAVFFSFGQTNLGQVIDFDDFPIELSDAWVGVSTAGHTVHPGDLPGDLVDIFDDPFTVIGDGVTFRADLASGGVIRDTANDIGLSGDIRIDGTLSTGTGALTGGEPVVPAGLDLTATFPSTSTGSWFQPTGDWTLGFSIDSGSVAASFNGSADITVDETTIPVDDVSIDVAYDKSAQTATFTISATIGDVDNLLGQSWLDLNSLTLDASISTNGEFEGGLDASLTLGDPPNDSTWDVSITFAAGSDGASGSLEITTDATVSLSEVAGALGATPPTELDVEIVGLILFAGFDSEGFTLAATTNLTVTINDADISSDVLFRMKTGGAQPEFLFGVKPAADATVVTVGALLGDQDIAGADIVLPSLTLTVASASDDITLVPDDLDLPTATYFGLEPGDEDLTIPLGVVITADVTLPQDLKNALEAAGISTEGNLELVGQLPVLGQSELSIAIQLPTIVPNSTVFKQVDLKLEFSFDTEQIPPEIKVSIGGDLAVDVPTTNSSECPCDTLNFDVEATLETKGASISIDLEGGLTAGDDGWQSPFGIQGLTINELRVLIKIKTGPPPSVEFGMFGDVNINGTDVQVAFLFDVTLTVPPVLVPQGFTFGLEELQVFSLADLVALHNLVIDPDLPPPQNLSVPSGIFLTDLVIAFGLETNVDLCIRQGFHASGQLHLVTEPDGSPDRHDGFNACDVLTGPDTPSAPAKCQTSATCLAAVLVNVETGVGTGEAGFDLEAFFAATDLGPLHFDQTHVILQLNSNDQRLFVSGGIKLDDPLDTEAPIDPWVDGDFELDFTPTQLKFDTEFDLLGGDALHFRAVGFASLTLDNPQFVIDPLEFRSDLLNRISEQTAEDWNQLVADVDAWAGRLAEARSDDPNLWRLLRLQLGDDAPPWLLTVVDTIVALQDDINATNELFKSHGLQEPFPQDPPIVDLMLNGFTIPGFPGIPGIVVDTFCVVPPGFPLDLCLVASSDQPTTCLGFLIGGECWLIPPTQPIEVPGLCDDAGFESDLGGLYAFLCPDDGNPQLVQVVGELFEDDLANSHNLDPGSKTGVEVLDTLSPLFIGGGVQTTCGYARVSYANHTVSETELTQIIHGKPVVFDLGLDLVNGDFGEGFPTNEALQQAFNTLIDENVDPTAGVCTENSVPAQPTTSSLSLNVAPSTINEGQQVTASGVAGVPGDVTSVEIRWGDGETSSAAIGAGGVFSATHIYTDDVGVGNSTTYSVRAQAGSASDTESVIVNNVNPGVAATLAAAAIDEGGTANLTVEFTDPGDDTHTVLVDWGDGARETVEDAVSPLELSHLYEDDDPTGTAADTYTVNVTVVDDDDGEAFTSPELTVNNVAPSGVTLQAVEVLGSDPTFDDEGNLLVVEGDAVRFELSISDAGVRDTHTVEIDWGDGGETQTVDNISAGQTYPLFHLFADDDPTATPSDTYTVAVNVTDDDLGVADLEAEVTVHNAVPVIDDLSLSTNIHNENEDGVTLGVEFSDRGVLDTHTLIIDWGVGWTEPADFLTSCSETAVTHTWDDGTTFSADVAGEDVRCTVIDIAALAELAEGAESPASPETTRTLTATNRYGDRGLYGIKVTIVDDDTGEDVGYRTLTVENVAPTHAINDSSIDGAVTTPAGDQVFIASAGDSVTISDTADDRGSDDLTFDWEFGDGNTESSPYLVGNPIAGEIDPLLSPQVQPRVDVTDEVTHIYGDACLYGVLVEVSDDNGGNGGVDNVAIVIQAGRDAGDFSQRNFGQWRDAIVEGDVSPDQLDCYLEIAGYLSSVLLGSLEQEDLWVQSGEVDATVLDENGVPVVLTEAAGSGDALEGERIKFDRALLSAWLNFADGAWEWDTLIEDSNGDGVLDTPFHQVIEEVELVRNNPEADAAEVREARQRLWQLGGG